MTDYLTDCFAYGFVYAAFGKIAQLSGRIWVKSVSDWSKRRKRSGAAVQV